LKTIICPECIKNYQTQPQSEEDLDIESEVQGTPIMTFSSWIPYAAHILISHPSSDRVYWVISSVQTEALKYKQDNKEIPKSIQTLIELIKTHGTSPALNVGTPLVQNAEVESQETPLQDNESEINKPVDWDSLLGDIDKMVQQIKDNKIKMEANKNKPDLKTKVINKIIPKQTVNNPDRNTVITKAESLKTKPKKRNSLVRFFLG
jgi:hypothetical protein